MTSQAVYDRRAKRTAELIAIKEAKQKRRENIREVKELIRQHKVSLEDLVQS